MNTFSSQAHSLTNQTQIFGNFLAQERCSQRIHQSSQKSEHLKRHFEKIIFKHLFWSYPVSLNYLQLITKLVSLFKYWSCLNLHMH
jgi:hypothetical protein